MTPQEKAEWKIKQLDKQLYSIELDSTERQLRLMTEKIAILKELHASLKEKPEDSEEESK
jgi:hypothetical protein